MDIDTTDAAAAEASGGQPSLASEAQDISHNERSSAAATRAVSLELAKTPPLSEVGIPRRDEVHSPQQPKSLQQEFLLVNFDVNNVKVTEVILLLRVR